MKRIKKIVTTILLGALTLSVFAFTGCGKTTEETSKTENADVGIAVLTSYEETTATGEKCLVKEVIATVSGVSETTQPIDLEWYTVWEHTNDADINDYLVLEPGAYNEETKSATCKIKLIAPITDTAVVYVKCNNNDLSARCTVDYSPSTHAILVDVSSLNVTQDTYYNTEINVLEEGTSYSFDISSLGFFDEEVSSDEIEVEYTAVGQFNIINDYSGSAGVSSKIGLTSFINPTVDFDTAISETAYKTYLKYSIEDNKLIINAVNSVYNLRYKVMVESTSTMNYFSFYSLVEENEPYVTLTLKNTSTNVSVSYNFRVYPKLSISLDKTTITFS